MTVKERLLADEYVCGMMINELTLPSMAHLFISAGVEILFVDAEHSYLTPRDISGFSAAARGLGVPVIVRIPENKIHESLQFVEAGATGILLAGTKRSEQIREVVEMIKYKPLGDRGIAIQALHNGYKKYPVKEYMKLANEETMVIAHIESVEGFKNLEEILSVPGVDGMTIGAMDYTNDLGDPGNFDLPEVQKALEKAVSVTGSLNRFCGVISSNASFGHRCIDAGMHLWVCGTDAGILMEGARKGVENFRTFTGTKSKTNG